MVTSYTLEANGSPVATFDTLVELPSEVEVIEVIQNLPSGEQVRKLQPGDPARATVTLERGLTPGLELWTWHEQARSGAPDLRRNVTLTGRDQAGTPVARWNLANAWPSAVRYTDPRVGSAVETVTFVADDVDRVAP